MSETVSEELTPALAAAVGVQLLLLAAGLRVLWSAWFSPAARDRRRAGSPLAPWLLSVPDFMAAALFVIGGGLVVQVTTGLIVRQLTARGWLTDPELNLVLQGAGFQIGLIVGAVMAFVFARGRSETVAPSPDTPRIGTLRGGLGAFLAALPVVTVLNLAWVGLLSSFGIEAPPQELVFLMADAESAFTTALLVVFAVLIAPLAEEVVFRAGLFRYLRTRVPRVIAYVLPAVIFGALHANLAAFVPLSALAVIFAIAYERTGNIGVPILAHALFNLNTVLLLFAGVTV